MGKSNFTVAEWRVVWGDTVVMKRVPVCYDLPFLCCIPIPFPAVAAGQAPSVIWGLKVDGLCKMGFC